MKIILASASGVRKKMCQDLMQCLSDNVDEQAGDVPLALSYENQEINADMRWNRNRVPSFMSNEALT